MRFSLRVPESLVQNRLATTRARLAASGRAVLDLTESNPTRVGIRYPGGLLEPLAREDALSYEPQPFGLLSAREAVAGDYARRGATVDASNVVLTASTSEAYSLLFKLLCDPGDRVLVPQPSYPLFTQLTRLDAVEAASYALTYEGRWAIDLDAVARALDDSAHALKPRAIVVVSPNNPTGSLMTAAELEAIVALARRHGVPLIGDEVFADYEIDPGTAPGSIAGQRDVLAFALGGLSKSAGLPQLKLGWMCVAGPDGARAAALERLEYIADAYLSVSTPVQLAAADLFAATAGVREAIRARVRGNYHRLQELAGRFPACRVLRVEAGWSAVIQAPAIRSEEELVLDLLEQDHVLVHPGYFFDFPREAFLVVSLLPEPAVFAAASERVLSRASG